MPRRDKSKEFRNFQHLTDRLLSVSKATVDKRIAAYEQEREKIPRQLRQGRNPKGYVRKSDREDV